VSVYFVYIITNPDKSTYYVGMTNNLQRRLREHFENRGNPKTFAGRYYCYKLLYWEEYPTALAAIEREKSIKKWSRKKKEALITSQNPTYKFFNEQVSG
jgi:putative endonuclease